MEQRCCCDRNGLADERLEKIRQCVDHYKSLKGPLIPVLHEIQDTYGYLPEDVLKMVSGELDIPLSEIYGVASFYSFFSLEPKGEHVIRVCMGTACYVQGAQTVLDNLVKELKVEVQKTTEDGKFTLEATRCLGACGLAPVMTIGGKVYGKVKATDIPNILKEYR